MRNPLISTRTVSTRNALAATAALLTTFIVGYASGLWPQSTVPEPTASTAAVRFPDYVALGDSYTSGPLIPGTRLDPLGCGRSTRNYPALLAQRIGARTVTDVSCGGATTEDLGHIQNTIAGANRPQLAALSPTTDLVTLGIGGNDESLFNSLVDVCPGLRGNDPAGAPCRAFFHGATDLFTTTARTGARVRDVLRGIHGRAPHATVLVIGYPRLAPEQGTCTPVLPLADGDYRFLDDVLRALNAELARAAAAEGATFVDTYPLSRGHDICAGEAEAWINGSDTKVHAALRFHPFAEAMAAEADLIADTLGRMAPPPGGGDLVAGPRRAELPVATGDQLDMLADRWSAGD